MVKNRTTKIIVLCRMETPEDSVSEDPIKLTRREREVLKAIVDGQSDKEIAVALNVTLHTINAFRKILLKKLGARNVASLVRLAIQLGLVQLD